MSWFFSHLMVPTLPRLSVFSFEKNHFKNCAKNFSNLKSFKMIFLKTEDGKPSKRLYHSMRKKSTHPFQIFNWYLIGLVFAKSPKNKKRIPIWNRLFAKKKMFFEYRSDFRSVVFRCFLDFSRKRVRWGTN